MLEGSNLKDDLNESEDADEQKRNKKMDNKECANEKIETTEEAELEKVTGGFGEGLEPSLDLYKAWGKDAKLRLYYEIRQREKMNLNALNNPAPSRQLPDAIKQRDEQHLRMEELYGSGN